MREKKDEYKLEMLEEWLREKQKSHLTRTQDYERCSMPISAQEEHVNTTCIEEILEQIEYLKANGHLRETGDA